MIMGASQGSSIFIFYGCYREKKWKTKPDDEITNEISTTEIEAMGFGILIHDC